MVFRRILGRGPVIVMAAWNVVVAGAQAQDAGELLVNGDFEAVGLADQSAWRPLPSSTTDAGHDTSAPAFEGRTSFRIARDAAASTSFVAMGQAVDAVPLRGKTVRLRAAGRVVGDQAVSNAGLSMRVDREGGGVGFFDNMTDRPIQNAEWAVYEIQGPVADDATRITVGLILRGAGAAWIDAASLEVLPGVPVDEADAAPLTARQLDNLAVFAKVYGYVRWFSPHSEPNDPRWDAIAAEGAGAVASLSSPDALVGTLRALFEPWAPGLVVGGEAEVTQAIPHVAADLVRWRHEGVEFGRTTYRSERVRAEQAEIWRAEVGAGLFVAVPLTASRSRLPADPQPADVPTRQNIADRATRLAATVIAWNVLRHFYPYFEDEGAAWDMRLRPWLGEAATAPDAEAFADLLRRMVAHLNDGHGEVLPAGGGFQLPLLWRWVDGALVVTAVTAGESEVAVGDVIVAIDGRPAQAVLEEAGERVSASTVAHRRWKAAETLRLRTSAEPVTLRLRGADGPDREIAVTPFGPARLEGRLEEARPAAVTWLPQGAWYFDITRLDERRLREALRYVRSDQPVIFDLRGYPHGVRPDFLGRLSNRPVGTPPFLVPVAHRPEARDREWKQEGWEVSPAHPRLRGRVAFLTDERAMSYSETLLAMVRGRQLAEIVGAPTAGANGNRNSFRLPGDYEVQWTGLKVINHDGSDLAGHGVQPTIAGAPTHGGVGEGGGGGGGGGIETVTRSGG